MNAKRVTLQDIADATGVTVNTVSRALKNKSDISRATCERIQRVAADMGYVKNFMASSLRSGRTRIIAMICGGMINPYYGILADSIQLEALRLGYSLLILASRDDPELERQAVEMAIARQVDGVLLFPGIGNCTSLDTLKTSGLPFVVMSRDLENEPDVDRVICDEEKGGRLAAEHLIAEGHRKLAFLSSFDVVYSTRMRFKGFREAALEAGIPESDIFSAICWSAEDITRTLLSWHESGVTGLFTFCDMEAWNAIDLLRRQGLSVPGDFGVVGFDNIQGAINLSTPVCSVDGSLQEEAALGIKMLRDRIHHPELPPQTKILDVSLVCRESCKKA
ncbi:MAG: LacI family transcriptional regulator [Clostridia bacterium]|nr:LacI family transcriptional regulator [Clostridia bacterium]